MTVSRQNAGARDGSVLHCAVTDVGLGELSAVLGVRLREVLPGGTPLRVDAKDRTGTGIGLYLCQHIITAHGGTIWCNAGEHGVGTPIATTLP